MISKVLKIQGVGKFKNYSSTGNDDLRFFKRNIIFGYNTHGKSTFTTILRSLSTSNVKYVEGKRTFKYTNDIVIDILDDNGKHLTLKNGNWSDPNIQIFDNYYIHNNIFVGDQINHGHKTCLHGIFIGENISTKVNNLNELRKKQAELERLRDDIKLQFAKQGIGSFEQFIKVIKLVDPEEQIKKKEEEIKRIRNIADLKSLVSRTPLNNTFENFSRIVQQTLDTSAEKNIQDHIEKNWKNKNGTKNFIADGVNLLKEDGNCVFCGQNLEPVSKLVSDFKNIFGETYRKTRDDIEKMAQSFLAIDLEAEFAKFLSLGLDCKDIIDFNLMVDAKSKLDDQIKRKLLDLNYEIDCQNSNSPFQLFKSELLKIHPILNKITQEEFSSVKVGLLENEIKTLRMSIFRFSVQGEDIFKKYTDACERLEIQKKEVNSFREQIDKETKELIRKNQGIINGILKDVLKADFLLQKLESRSNLNRADSHYIEYEFVIDGQVIPMSNKRSQGDEEPLEKAYFGNTLSDSDRRILAIAIFIASLSTDKNLKDKVVVLDDPFSSFDANRKDYLAKSIIGIKNEAGDSPAQLIVLTHDDGFLGRLHACFPHDETKLLRIKCNSIDGSVLDICNIEEIIEEEYFKNIKYIKDTVDYSRNIDESLHKVRKCLERVLRHKYYFSIDRERLVEGSITSFLECIGDKCPIKTKILDNNWHENMHDQHQIMKLQEPEKVEKLKEFLQMLEQI